MAYLPQMYSPEEDTAYYSAAVHYAAMVEVAEEDDRIVGFSVAHGGWLNALYVLPEYQGRGIGSVLLAQAMEANPAGLSLWVFEKNAGAQALYRRAGFVEVARTDGSGNLEKEPDVKMHWARR
jgi:GNAT superfamily N-acetyltransferase